jgi:hypothetical protein
LTVPQPAQARKRPRLPFDVRRQPTLLGGDLAAYHVKMRDTRAELALLPEPEKMITFDGVATIAMSMASALDAALPEKLKELVGLLVEKIVAMGDGTYAIEFVAAARPFFAGHPHLLMAPPDGLPGPDGKRRPIAW